LFEVTALYYDKYARVVQTRATNHLFGYDITYNKLDFRGKVTKSQKEHNISGQAVIPEVYRYAYDKAERLILTRYKLGANDTITLAANSYDDLGRLRVKVLGAVDATTYTYNIRSWTTEINGSRFSENLYYNSGPLNGANACYNGNIAAMQWSVANDNLNYNRAYSFAYDNLNRLTNANYYGFGNGSVVDGTSDKYNETFTFDKMGNFNSLTRNESGTAINNLSFTYIGNQISKVDNLISPAPFIPYGSEAFKDSLNVGTEYTYDKNGSTVSDLNTGISTIQYNLLNLPDQIQFIQGHKNLYTYDAAGKKLEAINYTVRDIVNVPIGTISTLPASSSDYTKLTTDYVGNMIYENGSLKEILLPEGYWQNGVYYYYLKDHLGNNRVVINNSGAVVEKSHYYPSGMRFYPESTSNSAALPYRYNGKELEAMNGLNEYDYGARRRGTGLPAFTSVDPLCEKHYNESPYVYCGNNPIIYTDPDGKEKFKLQGHFKVSFGFVGLGIKALGFKYNAKGATESELSFHISYDTKTNELGIGGANITREHGKGGLTVGGVIGGGETTQKETGTEVTASVNLKTGKLAAKATKINDGEFKAVGEGTIGILTGTEKKGEDHKFTLGLTPEVNLGIIGAGVGVNLSAQGNHGAEEKKENNNKK
jgi:RHS repeat-associated protein